MAARQLFNRRYRVLLERACHGAASHIVMKVSARMRHRGWPPARGHIATYPAFVRARRLLVRDATRALLRSSSFASFFHRGYR